MPCFLLIKLFISFFIIIVYYEVVIVLVTGEPGPVNSSVAAVFAVAVSPPKAKPAI
jgi:hypothetical protein